MDEDFVAVVLRLVAEQGREVFAGPKFKALLADYAQGEFKSERRLLVNALDTGCHKIISGADNLADCKRILVRRLREELFIDKTTAAAVAYLLCLALRGEAPPPDKPEPRSVPLPDSGSVPTSSLKSERPVNQAIDFVIKMVRVEGGTFMMGATSEQWDECDGWEFVHQVTLSTFAIGKYQVTQAQWRAVMGSNPSRFKGDDLPVEQVSWDDVQEFIGKLNARTGKNYRLPTEAEWEYAARGGARSRGYKYSGGNDADSVAWYDKNSGGKTYPVGQKISNELGLYDMSGNVWEWVNDWYDAYSAGEQTDPQGPTNGSNRVIRGGSWGSGARRLRVSLRSGSEPGDRDYDLGFRLARSSS